MFTSSRWSVNSPPTTSTWHGLLRVARPAPLAAPRRQENALLLKQIRQIHEESRGTYGSPRGHAELTRGLGLLVNLKRVARLMREAGLHGLYRRQRHGCTVRDPDAQPPPGQPPVHRGRPEPAVDHRYHRTSHRGGEGVLRGGD